MCPTRHRRIWVARQKPSSGSAIDTTMRTLRRAVSRGDAASTLALITRTVDDYTPSEQARARAEAQSVHSRGATVLAHKRTA